MEKQHQNEQQHGHGPCSVRHCMVCLAEHLEVEQAMLLQILLSQEELDKEEEKMMLFMRRYVNTRREFTENLIAKQGEILKIVNPQSESQGDTTEHE